VAATLICVFGFLVTPLWWGWAAFVWGYALVWFLATDPVKLLAYRVLGATPAVPAPRANAGSKAVTKAASKPDTETAPTGDAKAEPKLDTKAEPKPDADVAAKPDAEAAAKPDAEAAPMSDTKPDAKVVSKPEANVQPMPDAQDEPKAEAKAEPEAAANTATDEPDANAQPAANTGAATLLNRTLGDLLVAGLIKDPEDAGRIIAAAIGQAQMPIAAPKAPEAEVKSEPEAKANTLPAPTPKAAE